MFVSLKTFGVVAVVQCLVLAVPFPGDNTSLNHRAGLAKRKLYDLNDLSEQDQKDKLTQGLKDAVTIAGAVLGKDSQDGMDSKKHEDKLERWFGDKNSDTAARDKIRNVFKNFYGENEDGTGADVLGDVHVLKDDYWTPKPPIGDSKTPFCKLEKDGKSGTAYTKPFNKIPSMHFCPKVFDREKKLEDLLKNDCGSLGSVVNTDRMGKPFPGFAVLHEFIHFKEVGPKAVEVPSIGDTAYGADNCHRLSNDKDEEKRKLTIRNADTFVWFAMHIYLENACKKSFSYPRDDRDDDATQADFPDSSDEDENVVDVQTVTVIPVPVASATAAAA